MPPALGWLGASTQQIGLGSAVFQIPGRTPAMTVMTAATLDWFSGGRMLLGLGVSGRQVSEGWHGVGFEAPLARTREYLAIVRAVLNRSVVESPGPYYPLPLPGGRGQGPQTHRAPYPGTPADLPRCLVGPRNLIRRRDCRWLAGHFRQSGAQRRHSPRFARASQRRLRERGPGPCSTASMRSPRCRAPLMTTSRPPARALRRMWPCTWVDGIARRALLSRERHPDGLR